MRARLLVPLAALALVIAWAPAASAHPLGNFSVNHLTEVRISADRVDVLYLLDQAEVPTFQERNLGPAQILERKRSEVLAHLRLEVDGRPVPLRAGRGAVSFPAGQGGLKLTRMELPLSAAVSDPERVVLRDGTFRDRVGWKAVVIAPGEGTHVRSNVFAQDPTNGLRAYPEGTLASPLDQRQATFAVSPGGGTVSAPSPPPAYRAQEGADRGGDGFAGVFADAAAGEGVLVFLLLVAFGWGALHALSPGHGKAMVAAYLIGTRGTARHAVSLGAIVTITHTIGVFLLGFVTLLLSQYILPEDLYPWLNLTAGLLVVAVGVGVLRARIRFVKPRRSQAHFHHDHHHGRHGHGHDHHLHDHSHDIPDRVTWRGLVGMGTAAGLIPCPSALVVLLGAIAQHQIGLGLVLIVAFSLGLAATLTALGIAVVYAKRALARVHVPGPVMAALPAASAVLIVGVGLVLTAQAIPKF